MNNIYSQDAGFNNFTVLNTESGYITIGSYNEELNNIFNIEEIINFHIIQNSIIYFIFNDKIIYMFKDNIKIIQLDVYKSKVVNNVLIVENEYDIYIFNRSKYFIFQKNEIEEFDININNIIRIYHIYIDCLCIDYLQNNLYYEILLSIIKQEDDELQSGPSCKQSKCGSSCKLENINSLDINHNIGFQDVIIYQSNLYFIYNRSIVSNIKFRDDNFTKYDTVLSPEDINISNNKYLYFGNNYTLYNPTLYRIDDNIVPDVDNIILDIDSGTYYNNKIIRINFNRCKPIVLTNLNYFDLKDIIETIYSEKYRYVLFILYSGIIYACSFKKTFILINGEKLEFNTYKKMKVIKKIDTIHNIVGQENKVNIKSAASYI